MAELDVRYLGGLLLVALFCGLVAYRLARALTTDSLFVGSRERLEAWAYVLDDDGEPTWKAVRRRGRPDKFDLTTGEAVAVSEVRPLLTIARGKLADLLTCIHCTSMWFAAGAVCLLTSTWPWQLGWNGWLTAVAAAAVASFLGAVDGRS